MKRIILSLLSIASLAVAAPPTVGQLGIDFWTAAGPVRQWITPQNSKVIGINSSGQLTMASGGGATELGDLDGVALTSVTGGQILQFNATSGDWENATLLTSYTRSLLLKASAEEVRDLLELGVDHDPTFNQVTASQFNGALLGPVTISNGAALTFEHSNEGSGAVTSTLSVPADSEAGAWQTPEADGRLITDNSILNADRIGAGNLPIARIENGAITNAKLEHSAMTIGGQSVPLGNTITTTTILNSISSTRGTILYRGASGWAALAPGNSGYVLTSNGTGADPSYTALSGATLGANVFTGTQEISAGGNVHLRSYVDNTTLGFYAGFLVSPTNGIIGINGNVAFGCSAGNSNAFLTNSKLAIRSGMGFTFSSNPTHVVANSEDTGIHRAAASITVFTDGTASGAGSFRLRERTAPASAPPANSADVWLEDDGAGKSRLVIRFATGPVEVLELED